MTIYLINNCQSEVYVCLNDVWNGIIGPNKKTPIECDKSDELNLSVYVYHKKNKTGDIHNLNLITYYTFKNVENNAEFIITREKIRVALYVSYERLFINSTKAIKASEESFVKDSKRNDTNFKRNRIKELLIGPLADFTELCLILFIGGLLLGWLVNWHLLFIYYPLVYSILFGVHWIIDTFFKEVTRTRFNVDDASELYQFMNPDFIAYYYSQSNREPFLGKIDTK